MQSNYTIKTELINNVPPKRFVSGGKYHYYIRIYIDAEPETFLDSIELVKYTLHPTFRNRQRVSENRTSNFDIKIWSYGYFDTKALLLFRDGNTQEISGYVSWQIPKDMPFDDE